jgi:hypothetical protein
VAGGRWQEQTAQSSIFHFSFIIFHFPLKTGPVKTRAMQAMKSKKSEMENRKMRSPAFCRLLLPPAACSCRLPPASCRKICLSQPFLLRVEGKFASGGKAP